MREAKDLIVKRILFGGVGFLTVVFMVLAAILFNSAPGGGGGGGSGGSGGGSGSGNGGSETGPDSSVQTPSESQKTPGPPVEARSEIKPEPQILAANISPTAELGEEQKPSATAPAASGDGGAGGGKGTGHGTGTGSGNGSGSGGGEGSGSGGGKGEAEFMGAEAVGDSFVYVVDRSGSMSGRNLELAKNELFESINALTRYQRFFVYFYNTDSVAMPQTLSSARQLEAATQKNREACIWWAQTIQAEGGTNPENALLEAAMMGPAAIFLMSDGAFTLSPEVLMRLQASRVPIHTISFMNKGGENVLKRIAEATGGKYRVYMGQP